MRRVLFVAVLAMAACRDRQVEQLEDVRQTVCACKTVACGEAALAKVPKDDVESTHRTQQLAREMLDCLAKLYEQQRRAAEDSAGSDDDSGSAAGDGSGSGSAVSGSAASGSGSGGSATAH